MNDLDLITELRPDVPLADACGLTGPRARLTTQLSAPGAGRRRARRATNRHRLAWRISLAGATAVAAAAVAVALLLTSAVPSRGPGAASNRARPARSAPGNRHPRRIAVPATLTAAQFLNSAAAATARRTAAPPRPDQYVYTKDVTPGEGWSKEWLSANGARPGLAEVSNSPAGSGTTEPACTVAQAKRTGCYIAAGYLPGFPVHAKAVLAYLARLDLAVTSPPGPDEPANWLANDTGKAIGALLQTTYLLPAQQSAIFRLLARTPGFRIVRSADDPIGRPGVGIYWAYQGSGAMITFNPATYAFLGFGTWPVGPQPVLTGHNVKAPDGTALTATAIVNALPPHHTPPTAKPPLPRHGRTRALARLLPQVRRWAAATHQRGTVVQVVIAYLRRVLHLSGARLHAALDKLGIDSAS
jgi:hypothetical protein